MARRINPIQERQRRATLEKAAYLAIAEHGYAGVTLDEVAARAGVSKGTLVYYFGSKAGLLAAVTRRFVRTISVATRRALRLAQGPDEALRAYVEHQFYSVGSSRRFFAVYLDFVAASTRDPALLVVQRDFLAGALELDRELAGDDHRAWLMRALVDGLSVRFLADPDPDLEVYRSACLAGIRAVVNRPA